MDLKLINEKDKDNNAVFSALLKFEQIKELYKKPFYSSYCSHRCLCFDADSGNRRWF